MSPPVPEILPIFPLTGSLLLPGNFLPLNVFEPRYRRMVEDAIEGPRHFGMIQPRTPEPDNYGPVGEASSPELYGVGCAGYIQECEPQPDGRYLIVLRGVSRFRVAEELPLQNGYRRVVPSYEEFSADLETTDSGMQPGRVVAAVERFGERHGLEFDHDLLIALPGVTLVNALCAALPFPAGEKQALLEAPSPREREELLLELMGMGMDPPAPGERYRPPIVN